MLWMAYSCSCHETLKKCGSTRTSQSLNSQGHTAHNSNEHQHVFCAFCHLAGKNSPRGNDFDSLCCPECISTKIIRKYALTCFPGWAQYALILVRIQTHHFRKLKTVFPILFGFFKESFREEASKSNSNENPEEYAHVTRISSF